MKLLPLFIFTLFLTSALTQNQPRLLYLTGAVGVPYAGGLYGAGVLPAYGYPYGAGLTYAGVPYGYGVGGVYGARPLATQSSGVQTVVVRENGTSTTVTCDPSCASCLGPASDQCLSCAVGRYPQRLEGKNTLVCLLNSSENS
eukprot:TRINITY_DN6605_c0_g1_i13.p2 TRINITY_DN6605_c0_g1~~TRINITY_DN6605_c0_g1_i13.p2  ORF type:complete len:143 (-),score=12.66 TRINITY_DN6605_c0_g1_i13:186-614(-)